MLVSANLTPLLGVSYSHKHLTPIFGVPLTPLFLQCNEADRKLLNKLYPACSSRSRPSLPQKRKFNPLDHSIAEKNKVKKKAAIPKVCKMRTVTAVLLDHLTSTVPRATARKRLMADGRIKKIQIRRSMNPSVIR